MNWSVETVRDWLRQACAWDFAERQNLQRAAASMAYGLSPEQYARPFPGSPGSSVVIMNQAIPAEPMTPPVKVPVAEAPPKASLPLAAIPDAAGGVSKWAAAGIAAAALALGGLGAVAVMGLMGSSTKTSQPQEWQIKWRVTSDGKTVTTAAPVEQK